MAFYRGCNPAVRTCMPATIFLVSSHTPSTLPMFTHHGCTCTHACIHVALKNHYSSPGDLDQWHIDTLADALVQMDGWMLLVLSLALVCHLPLNPAHADKHTATQGNCVLQPCAAPIGNCCHPLSCLALSCCLLAQHPAPTITGH